MGWKLRWLDVMKIKTNVIICH